jgi:hypothetical protein
MNDNIIGKKQRGDRICVINDHAGPNGLWLELTGNLGFVKRESINGRWVLDKQSNKFFVPCNKDGETIRQDDIAPVNLSHSSVCNVMQLGTKMGCDFESLMKFYNQNTVVDEVRVFGASLTNQRIIHYKTKDEGVCERALRDVMGIAREAAAR